MSNKLSFVAKKKKNQDATLYYYFLEVFLSILSFISNQAGNLRGLGSFNPT